MNLKQKIDLVLDAEAATADRILAVEELRKTKPVEAIVPLTLELQRENEELKEVIRSALSEMHATAFIAEDLRSPDQETRLKAAELLALIPAPEGVDPLIRGLSDPLAKVRERCAGALWLYGDARAVEPLVGTLSDPDPDVRCAAAQSLGRLGGTDTVGALEAAHARETDAFARLLMGEALVALTSQ